jgi:hypothetical protein
MGTFLLSANTMYSAIILDTAHFSRKTFANSSTETGAGYAYWDGRYVDGLVVPGVYKYRINASNSYGSDVREGDITVTTYYQQNYYGAQNPYYYVPGNKYYYYGAIPCAGFIDLIMKSRYIVVIEAIVFLVVIVCLWTKRTALAALLLLPFTVNIVGFHAFLDGGPFTAGAMMGNVLLLLNLAFLWQQRAQYRTLFQKHS